MAGRRLLYLAVLEGCLVFYVAYREWFAWLALVAVAFLPLLSLLVSLPAMLTVKTALRCPAEIPVGTPVSPELEISCKLPSPPVRCRLKVRHSITGQQDICKAGSPLLTECCGVLELRPGCVWVYDYLGLWRLPRRRKAPHMLAVLPAPVKVEKIPSLERYIATAWKPKAGGFAENHELRLYRPGDDLRQIHWKLSSKTGKLIFREPMEPVKQRLILTLVLCGTVSQLNSKLGRLLWLSGYLLEQGLPHEVRCLTGRGIEAFPVSDDVLRTAAIRAILSAPASTEQPMPESLDAAWHYLIGGDPDET